MKKIILLFALLGPVSWVLAQPNPLGPSATATNDVMESPPFIGSAKEMADHLRSEYGIAKSVYLTQIAHQLSQSFASTEQLQQQWQQALTTAVTEPTHYTQINSHALMAQTLIQYTNGMTLNRWRQVNLPLAPKFKGLNEPHTNAQTFQTWLNLDYHWQQIIANDSRNNLNQWLMWLEAEVTLNPELISAENAFNLLLTQLTQSTIENHQQLTQLAGKVGYFRPLSTALVRQKYHLYNNQTLALAYDWVEIYQLLELSGELLTATQQQQLSQLLSTTTVYWRAAEVEISNINGSLFDLINQLLSALPEKFKNPDHFNHTLNQQILTWITGLDNPNAYFNHPLRNDIQENLEVCLNLSVQQNPEPPVPIALNQFNSCLADFIQWGTVTAKSSDLSGNLIKLDSPVSINRALELPSIQIINNLTMQAAKEVRCQQQLQLQANPVEWLLAAETISWFHDRWPGVMASHLEKNHVERLINTGKQLYQFPECLTEAEPLIAQFESLKGKWERLKQEILIHVDDYSSSQLSSNSDVNLFKSIDQKTNYIPESFMVTPCDATQSCGALVTLEPSNELLNLFPNHLKLAEQFGLGQLGICYDQVQWQNRKATPSHLDNNKIANFEGQLSIQLNGQFRGESVFTKTLLSEQRHIYLFGQNDQRTLDTSCPLPLIGQQINTTLDRGTFGLFPNRLTFLAAQKIDINAVIRKNWTQWQTQLNTQPKEFNFYNEMNGIKTVLNDAFLQRVNELQQQIYRKVITTNQSRTTDSALSKAAFEFNTHRQLLSHMTTGLFPQLYANRDTLQGALSGNNRLVDMDFFRESFKNQINVADMIAAGDANFEVHQAAWGGVNQIESLIHNTLDQLQQILDFSISESEAPVDSQ